MGLLNLLFGGGSSKEACEVKIELSESEMIQWSLHYYRGSTSYRRYFIYVIARNMERLTPITEGASSKAAQGCDIDDVYVNFYYSNSNYILIPFDLFSEKEDMTISRRNNKTWNRDNILRILKNYPNLRDYDDSVVNLRNEQEGITPIPEPIPAPKPEPIIPKPIVPPKPKKPQSVILKSNGKSRLIAQTQTITREIVKSAFGNHNEIYNKQFEIMKDNNGDWFVKGYDAPSESKDAKGNIYKFYKTFYNGQNVTNKFTKLENGGVIKVGNTEFLIELN